MFEHVLVCTNFTDGLQRLLKFIPSLAEGGMRSITFLHVVPLLDEQIPRENSDRTKAARDRLQRLLGKVPNGVEVQLEVLSGKPVDTILHAVKTHRAELLIMGMPSRSVLNEKLFGSTTMGVCQRLAIPILSLRPPLISSMTTEELSLRCQHLFQHVLITYDGSSAGDYLVQKIKQRFQEKPSGVAAHYYLYWAMEDVSRNPALREGKAQVAQQALASVKADLEALGLAVTAEVVHGKSETVILEAAQEQYVSAIAVASERMGSIREWPTPSFAGEILRQSWHPVLYFPMVKS